MRATRGACELSDRDEIGVGNVAHVANIQREQSAGSTRRRNEFDLDAVRLVDFDDRAEVADPEPMLREIAIENNGFPQGVIHHAITILPY